MAGIKGFLLIALTLAALVHGKKLPDKYLGTFRLERTMNFDEYLIAKGYRWLTRRLIMLATVTKIISKAASGLPFRYDMETLTWKKNVNYRDVIIGKEFRSDHFEDGTYVVKVDLDGDSLVEKIFNIDDPTYNETFTYTRDGDYLIMKCEWKGIQAEGFYRKEGF